MNMMGQRMATDNIVEAHNISKHFGGVKALRDVSLDVRRGEIHAIIGENGAGKSTLMKILAGAYKRDSGTIRIDGELVEAQSPRDIINRGVSVIYQEFMLAPELTVAENIFIDDLQQAKPLINWRNLNRRASQELEKLGFGHIKPTTKVRNLSVAYQQIVEICKSLVKQSKLIILDEPTAVLTHSETEGLLDLIRNLNRDGVTIIYISHRLKELFAISDRITVLKDGGYVDTVETSSMNEEQLVTMMVGREIAQLFPAREGSASDWENSEELLRVEKLSVGDRVKDVSFTVRRGEIVGFSGLIGAGRTETMRAIFGADRKSSGEIFWKGKPFAPRNPREAIRKGIGLLSEDRKGQGLVLEQPIRVNSTLVSQRGNGIIDSRAERRRVIDLLNGISTRYGSINDNVASLSGGNQQKVSLAKWLAVDTELIILDEPTRGVDVGAKVEMYGLINALADRGIGVIVVSSEMIEIIGLCDRAIVMREGEVAGELGKQELTENNLIKQAMGV